MAKITELQIEKWKHKGDVTALVFGIRELEAANKTSQAKNRKLRGEVKLWKNRVDEAAKVVATFEELQAKVKRLEEEIEQWKKAFTLVANCHNRDKLFDRLKKALRVGK